MFYSGFKDKESLSLDILPLLNFTLIITINLGKDNFLIIITDNYASQYAHNKHSIFS